MLLFKYPVGQKKKKSEIVIQLYYSSFEFDFFLCWLQIQMAEIKWITMGKNYLRGNEKEKRGI